MTTHATGQTIDILSSLIAFDTTSAKSNLPLLSWVEDYLDRHGIASERVYDATGQKASLWATIGPADQPGYVLSGHTDTVPVDGQDWTSDPYSLTPRGERLYGRGTCDMKGFLAASLARVPEMKSANLAAPIHLAFSYDEEIGCVGVRPLLEKLSRQPMRPRACFVGEPTSMQVVVGHKGKRSLRATVRGHSVHSSLAPQGVNALEYAARLVVHIREIGQRLALHGPRDELYDVPYSTAHTGILRSGVALNIVPDEARIEYEFRTVGADDPDALVAEADRYVREVLEPEMQAIEPGTGFTIVPKSGFPGLETSADAEVTTLAKALAGRNDHGKVAFGTEAGLFVAMAGIPTVVIGPGSIEQAHKADEFVEIDQLARCEGFIDRLIAHCGSTS